MRKSEGARAAASVAQYVASLPPETQAALGALRAAVREGSPEATERLSYGMIGCRRHGRYLLYLGGFKRHVGLYPVTAGLAEAFGEALAPYRSGKATLRFLHGRPFPHELVRRIVAFREAEENARAAGE